MSANMFSLGNMPSTTKLLSAYTTVVGTAMLVRTIVNEAKNFNDEYIPEQLREKILSLFGALHAKTSSNKLTIVVDDCNYSTNQVYEAVEIYLSTKTSNPTIQRLKASKRVKDKSLAITVDQNQVIREVFQGIPVEWELISIKSESRGTDEQRFFELRFDKAYKDVMVETYLPYILETAKNISKKNKFLKLKGDWGSVNFDHPITFDKLAMEPELKKKVIDDLDRFLKRREFYRRVGKPWKRGYLLYGPPGTGKSSLIAAMANYLKFNIYNVELANVRSTSDLLSLLISIKNKTIIVIEDIDCSVQFHNREDTDDDDYSDEEGPSIVDQTVTLSGMLNFIDGLWSCCGDERIIIFTTNHKDKLDPALLRPGRMDMHILMSYLTPPAFRVLASNYLEIQKHPLFEEIETLLSEVNATPAEVAEQLMRSEEADTCLEGVIEFLKEKKNAPEEKESDIQSQDSEDIDTDEEDNIEQESPSLASYIFFGGWL